MEIERKFLVKDLPNNLKQYAHKELSQVYISQSPTIRLRKQDNEYILTVKGSGLLAHEEFELALTKEQYEKLYQKRETPAVDKTRYLIALQDGLTAELDKYYGALAGLWTVEVEFPSLEACYAFEPPCWFGKDISADERYKNTNLCLHGIPISEEG